MSLRLNAAGMQSRVYLSGVTSDAITIFAHIKQVVDGGAFAPVLTIVDDSGDAYQGFQRGLFLDHSAGSPILIAAEGDAGTKSSSIGGAPAAWKGAAFVGRNSGGVKARAWLEGGTAQEISKAAMPVSVAFFGNDWFGRASDFLFANLRIWNVALSDAELAAEAASATPVRTSGLIYAASLNAPVTGNATADVAAAIATQQIIDGTHASSGLVYAGLPIASADYPSLSGSSGIALTGGGSFPTATSPITGIVATPLAPSMQVGASVIITVKDSNGDTIPAGLATVTYPLGLSGAGQVDANGQFTVTASAAMTPGQYPLGIKFIDPIAGEMNVTLNVTVLAAGPVVVAPVWVTTTIPAAAAGKSYRAPAQATGASSYAKASGPSWMVVDPVTGTISGTAPAGTSTGTITVDAINAVGTTSQALTINVVASPFASSTLPGGTVGTPYSYALGAAAAGFSAVGLAAIGLAIDPTSGAITGTPTTSGNFSIPVTATFADGTTQVATFALAIAPAAGAGGTVQPAALGRAIPRPRRRVFTALEIAVAISLLMPRGLAWNRDPGTVQQQLIQAMGDFYAQLQARADYLLTDASPAYTLELLPEWEATLGLPDPCAGAAPTIQQRRAQVLARVAAKGGASIAYLQAFAADLGFTVTVQGTRTAKCGQATCGQPMNGPAWAHAFVVSAPTYSVQYARAGQAVCGEPIATWANTVLECALRSVAPAHSIPIFQYT